MTDTPQAVSGVLAPTGALAASRVPKNYTASPSGAVIPTGLLTSGKIYNRSPGGTLAPTGALALILYESLGGGVTPAGTLGRSRAPDGSVSGSLVPAGVLATTHNVYTYFVRVDPEFSRRQFEHPYYIQHFKPTTNYPDLIVEGDSTLQIQFRAQGTETVTIRSGQIGSRGFSKGSILPTKEEQAPYWPIIVQGVKYSIKLGAKDVEVPHIVANVLRESGLL